MDKSMFNGLKLDLEPFDEEPKSQWDKPCGSFERNRLTLFKLNQTRPVDSILFQLKPNVPDCLKPPKRIFESFSWDDLEIPEVKP